MAAMTLPMVPPSFGYGRSDRRTPPESSVVRNTPGLRPSQTATRDQRREVHSAWLRSATNPSGSASCQDLLTCGSPSFGSPSPMTGPLAGRHRGYLGGRASASPRTSAESSVAAPARTMANSGGCSPPRSLLSARRLRHACSSDRRCHGTQRLRRDSRLGFLPVNVFVLHDEQPVAIDSGLSTADKTPRRICSCTDLGRGLP